MKSKLDQLPLSLRVQQLKSVMFAEERFASIEQAKIVTDVYRTHGELPRNILRALALKEALTRIEIRITEGELIVGNRTTGVRAGVIFPESGLSWVDREIETLPTRPQDPFQIREEDIHSFKDEIFPFWQGKTLEDILDDRIGDEMRAIGKVAKINQTDHAQGHICPNTERWLKFGPAGLIAEAKAEREQHPDNAVFYDALILSLEGACLFMKRYAKLAREMADDSIRREELLEIAQVCDALSERAPETFREAVQASWFLYVILQMESNASTGLSLMEYLNSLRMEAAKAMLAASNMNTEEIAYRTGYHSTKFFYRAFRAYTGMSTREYRKSESETRATGS